MNSQNQTKAHIVLSSGGIRCVSYAGAIAELEKIGVEIASVSACSGGSLGRGFVLRGDFGGGIGKAKSRARF